MVQVRASKKRVRSPYILYTHYILYIWFRFGHGGSRVRGGRWWRGCCEEQSGREGAARSNPDNARSNLDEPRSNLEQGKEMPAAISTP